MKIILLSASQRTVYLSNNRYNYVVKLNGVPSTITPDDLELTYSKIVNDFIKTAKRDNAPCKGRPSLPAVKRLIAAISPTQVYARWRKDSADWKDDSVDIYYV